MKIWVAKNVTLLVVHVGHNMIVSLAAVELIIKWMVFLIFVKIVNALLEINVIQLVSVALQLL